MKKLSIFIIILSASALWLFKAPTHPLDVKGTSSALVGIAQAANPGNLIKAGNSQSVYYLGDDNKRYVFPSEDVYFSWYKNFDDVITVTEAELQSYPLGANVTMRPGTKLIKITTDPAVYAVEPSGILRKIKDEAQAKQIFGDNWAQRIVDIPDVFFINYSLSSELRDGEFPAGSIIRDLGAEKYYYYDKDGFRQITSSEAFNNNRFYSKYLLQSSIVINSQSAPINGGDQYILGLIQRKASGSNGDQAQNNENNDPPAANNNTGGGGGGSVGGGGGSVGGGGDGGNIVTTCSGAYTQSCTVSHGIGTQTRTCDNGTWSNWSACTTSACDNGYTLIGNSCSDTSAPTITQFIIPENASSLTVPITSLLASDLAGVTAYILTEIITAPGLADAGWSPNAPSLYTFLSDGSKTLYAWARDAAGNISNPANDSVSIVLPPSNAIYIDPGHSNGANENGTIELPYNSFSDFSIQSGYTYLLKRGSVYSASSSITINNLNDVTLSAYGNGARPKFLYSGSGGTNANAIWVSNSSNFSILGWEVAGANNNIYSLFRFDGGTPYNTGVKIDDCSFHESWQSASYSNAGAQGGFGLRIGNAQGMQILNTEIYNIGIDGIYAVNIPDLEIAYTNIHHVNTLFFTEPNQTYSSGDGIQLGGWYGGFHIHHSTIDRSDGAGNKFNIILASPVGVSDSANGILEYNTFKTAGGVAWAIHIEMGNGIISRYNTFQGSTEGIRVAGRYTSNNLIYGNIFYNSTRGVSVNSTFINSVAYPAIGTKIYNNVFYNVGNHIWLQRTNVETKNNIHVRVGSGDVAIFNYYGGSWNITNNCYDSAATAGSPGTGANAIIADPLFVNASAYNFRLQTGSPCINAGANVSLPYPYDRDGVSIPQGSAADIGAYEY